MAGVAQLVEHQIVALVVAGSSPVARPYKKSGGSISTAFFYGYLPFRLFRVLVALLCTACLAVLRRKRLPWYRTSLSSRHFLHFSHSLL